MHGVALLAVYCVCAIAISLAGGLVPLAVRLTHRRLEIGLSFVSGVMLGVALLHMLPHALVEMAAGEAVEAHGAVDAHDHAIARHDGEGDAAAHGRGSGADGEGEPGAAHAHAADPAVAKTMLALLAGFLAMFLIERFFSFHHHEIPAGAEGSPAHHDHCGSDSDRGRAHRLTWTGAAIGLTLHTLISGVALAASVESESAGRVAGGMLEPWTWAGFATFLVVVLHKPFDSLSIGTLMAAGDRGLRARHVVNGLFSLSIPAGVALFHLGAIGAGGQVHELIGVALAFSAGTFLCIALSDLLPELQFHRHDRVWLSLALAAGLVVAWLSGAAE